ncbi:uncharacterized protein LOC106143279 [Amyelois transitella]|uniref:uncharacterized protein LOC106143279 n=1 Tax=Amyelois transitella TaxID=680683 RepID=UPI00067B5483|nr:uncharacterized protein LOC106143279 [Amyelois transitella]
MDGTCIYLTIILLTQMCFTLGMLNPIHDIKKIASIIRMTTTKRRSSYFICILVYFCSIIYLGMYIPLQNIHRLIFSGSFTEYEKLLLLNRIERNYIIAGFSLFLVVVMYGVRSLVTYTADLADITERQVPLLFDRNNPRNGKNNAIGVRENILPGLLRVKRSISYETILFTNELREHLKAVIKNIALPQGNCTLSSLLETNTLKQLTC